MYLLNLRPSPKAESRYLSSFDHSIMQFSDCQYLDRNSLLTVSYHATRPRWPDRLAVYRSSRSVIYAHHIVIHFFLVLF